MEKVTAPWKRHEQSQVMDTCCALCPSLPLSLTQKADAQHNWVLAKPVAVKALAAERETCVRWWCERESMCEQHLCTKESGEMPAFVHVQWVM